MIGLNRQFLLIAVFGSLTFGADAVENDSSVLETLFGEEATAHFSTLRVEWRPGLETVVWVDRSDGTNSILMEYDPVSGTRRSLLDDGD